MHLDVMCDKILSFLFLPSCCHPIVNSHLMKRLLFKMAIHLLCSHFQNTVLFDPLLLEDMTARRHILLLPPLKHLTLLKIY